jgi:hypothetical protein
LRLYLREIKEVEEKPLTRMHSPELIFELEKTVLKITIRTRN